MDLGGGLLLYGNESGKSHEEGVTSLPVTPGGTSGHLGGKTGDNWTQVQWNTRPRTVVNHYTGGDKTNG